MFLSCIIPVFLVTLACQVQARSCPEPAKTSGNRCICPESAPVCVGPECLRGERTNGEILQIFPVDCSTCRCIREEDSEKKKFVVSENPRHVPKLSKDLVCTAGFCCWVYRYLFIKHGHDYRYVDFVCDYRFRPRPTRRTSWTKCQKPWRGFDHTWTRRILPR